MSSFDVAHGGCRPRVWLRLLIYFNISSPAPCRAYVSFDSILRRINVIQRRRQEPPAALFPHTLQPVRFPRYGRHRKQVSHPSSASLHILTMLRRLYLHSYNTGKVVSIGLPDGKTVNCIEPVLGSDCVALGCRFDCSMFLLHCACDAFCSDGILRLLSLADLKVSVPQLAACCSPVHTCICRYANVEETPNSRSTLKPFATSPAPLIGRGRRTCCPSLSTVPSPCGLRSVALDPAAPPSTGGRIVLSCRVAPSFHL